MRPPLPLDTTHQNHDHPARAEDMGAIDPGGGLDLIGDIHGHAETLIRMLAAMDYELIDGIPRHRHRTAVFLGDYIDRGPSVRRTVELVRGMVDRGDAIALMGNHEYNAIAWFTPRPDQPNVSCRRHTPIRRRLIAPTLDSLGEKTPEWIEWMRGLPMWMQSDRIRAVHACWNDHAVGLLGELVAPSGGVLIESAMQATCKPGSRPSRALEQLLKGEEISLPQDLILNDPEGSPRQHIRARWFEDPAGRSYRDYAMTGDPRFPETIIPAEAIPTDFVPYGREERPIFVGHYWMQGDRPARLANNVACLDWSVARGGPMVAYRFDGEDEIENERFVAVV